jgi:hypothetical protein
MARSAKVVDTFGQVDRKAGSGWRKVSVGDVLPEGTTLRTGANGAALLLLLQDGHRVRIGEKTLITLSKLGEGKNYALNVMAGQVWSLVRKASQPASFRVETPSAVAGVTGTLFGVALDDETGETVVDTNEGSVEVSQPGTLASERPLSVRAGQFLRVPRRGRPNAGVLRHGMGNKAMWRHLEGEGGWARQDGRGPLKLKRERESQLRRWWRAGDREPIFGRGRK